MTNVIQYIPNYENKIEYIIEKIKHIRNIQIKSKRLRLMLTNMETELSLL